MNASTNPSSLKAQQYIALRGVRTGNLANIDVAIPHNQLTILTGPSGSGKTALAIHTLCAESQRHLANVLTLSKRHHSVFGIQPEFDSLTGLLPTIDISHAVENIPKRVRLYEFLGIVPLLSKFFCDFGVPSCLCCGLEMQLAVPKFIAQQIIGEILAAKQDRKEEFAFGVGLVIPIRLSPTQHSKTKQKNSKREHFIKQSLLYLINTFRGLGFRRFVLHNRLLKFSLYERNERTTEDHAVAQDMETLADSLYDDSTRQNLNLIVVIESLRVTCDSEENLTTAIEQALNLPLPITEPLFSNMISPSSRIIAIQDLSSFEQDSSITSTIKAPQTIRQVWYASSEYFCLPCLSVTQQLSPHNLEPSAEAFCQACGGNGQIGSQKQTSDCNYCHGSGIGDEIQRWKLFGKDLSQLIAGTAEDLLLFLAKLKEHHSAGNELSGSYSVNMAYLHTQLDSLNLLHLEKLPLKRHLDTLSSGEQWKVIVLGTLVQGLRETLFVLDEPSRYLHPYDLALLYQGIKQLISQGNTVLIVENNEEFAGQADFVIELKLHQNRGIVRFQGPAKEWLEWSFQKESALSQNIAATSTLPSILRKNAHSLKVSQHQDLEIGEIKIPTNQVVALVGIAGSGKTTLLRALASKLVLLGKPRTNILCMLHGELPGIERTLGRKRKQSLQESSLTVASFVGIDTMIAQIFASLPLSRRLELSLNDYLLNRRGGRCVACQGTGLQKIDLDFIGYGFEVCDICLGKRFLLRTLKATFSGCSIADVYECTIQEALSLFSHHQTLIQKLEFLSSFGLVQIVLGQTLGSLPWNSLARLTLAKNLLHLEGKQAWLLFDQPFAGLSSDEVLLCFKKMRGAHEAGLSFVYSTHDINALQVSDCIIELGVKTKSCIF